VAASESGGPEPSEARNCLLAKRFTDGVVAYGPTTIKGTGSSSAWLGEHLGRVVS
jgi:hypothetical protein